MCLTTLTCSGSMLAFTLSNILLLVFLLIYIKFWREDMNTWDGWSYECLLNWDQFLCLALPGIMSCILNYLNMEFINIFAGSMGEKQLATSVVIIDTVTFLSLVRLNLLAVELWELIPPPPLPPIMSPFACQCTPFLEMTVSKIHDS